MGRRTPPDFGNSLGQFSVFLSLFTNFVFGMVVILVLLVLKRLGNPYIKDTQKPIHRDLGK